MSTKILYHLIIVCILCSMCKQSMAQDYVIEHDGNKITGEIKNQNNYDQVVKIKADNSSSYNSYTASEVNEFSKQGQLYKSFSKDGSSSFYRRLSRGTISLYLGANERKLTEFIAIKDGQRYDLKRTETLIDNKITANNEYVSNLKTIVQDNHELFREVDKLQFIESKMKEFINRYNKSAGTYTEVVKYRKLKILKRIYLSLAYPGIVTSASINNEEAESKVNLGGGILLELLNDNGFGFQGGVNLISFSNRIDAGRSTFNDIFIEAEALLINIPFQLKYTFQDNPIQPSIYAGLSYGIILKDGFNLQRVALNPVTESSTEFLSFDSRVDLGFSAGIGTRIQDSFTIDLSVYSHLFAVLATGGQTQQFRASPISLSLGYAF